MDGRVPAITEEDGCGDDGDDSSKVSVVIELVAVVGEAVCVGLVLTGPP